MGVKVKIPPMFQPATGGLKTTDVDCRTIGECFTKLSDEYPGLRKMLFDEGDKIAGFLVVFVNNKVVNDNILAAPLKSGDELYPMMLIDGG